MTNNYTQPIESFEQYTDKQGNVYIAVPPKDLNKEPWFNEMIEMYGLEKLIQMFPYVILTVDPNTGMLVSNVNTDYPPKVTNNFHILYAKQKDSKPTVQSDPYYELNLRDIYPQNKPEEPKTITFQKENIVQQPNEGVALDNDKLPENIQIAPVQNWHPNKDEKGNFMSPSQFKQQAQYLNNNTNQVFNRSYIPRYNTLNNIQPAAYPF